MASLYIKDGETAALVARLAERRGITKTEAVRRAVEGELARDAPHRSGREVLTAFDRRYPLPEPTGLKADKSFFDDLSGNL